jgi:aminopeptidase N
MKAGLHLYFQKYKWKNTEFSDFIGTLQEAYDAKNDTSMASLSSSVNGAING